MIWNIPEHSPAIVPKVETKYSLEETFQTITVECSRMFQNSDSLITDFEDLGQTFGTNRTRYGVPAELKTEIRVYSIKIFVQSVMQYIITSNQDNL